ncbi:MAG: molybdopterin-dependent oxidoreductase [Actinomycetota bacterium]|nr:molybdopterin-dependent oxidoreductase [Actinomycetota bacterium]
MDRKQARIAGLIAAVLALISLWVVSAIDGTIPFPPTALADRFIRATPGDVATFFIELLHKWAMRALSAGVVVVTLGLGAEALARSARSGPPRPRATAAVLAVAAALAGLASPQKVSVVGMLFSATFAGVVYAIVATRLYGGLTTEAGADESRRRALRAGFGGALGLALAGGAIGWALKRLSGPDRDVALVSPESPATIPDRPGFPEVAGLTPEVTSARDHYEVDINLVPPAVEVDTWRLRVEGEVDRPLDLDFEGLQANYEIVEQYSVLSCVSNEVGGDLVGNSAWGGVRLRDVLKDAGVKAGAVDIVLRAADGYSDSIPVEVAQDPEVIIAVSQNGEPLTQGHGFPCRLRVPPIYGMKNVKWIESIEVVTEDYQGYWQKRGWSDDATVRTQSRIDVAGDEDGIEVGRPTWIAGVAWAGDRGIDRVEVSLDDGDTWRRAGLKDPIAPDSWTQWAYEWTPEKAGSITIQCRATDGNGEVQVIQTAPPHPAGSTGYHSVEAQVG